MPMFPSCTLIARIRKRELNFERFVEILTTRGYFTEQVHEEGCGFSSVAMEAAKQNDFDSLYQLLMPDAPRNHNISLSCIATDEGGLRGGYSYALFNENLISRGNIKNLLIEENRATSRWIESHD
jgi:hypothetical protein